MTRKASAAIPLLIVLIVITLSLGGVVFYLLQKVQKVQTENLALQGQLESTVAKYKKTESDLEGAKKKLSALDFQLREIQGKVESLTNELEQEKTAKQEALANIEQLRADLEQQKGSRSDLEKKLIQAQEDVKKTQQELKELGTQKADLETKIKDLEAKSQGVELGKIVVNPETGTLESKEQPLESDIERSKKSALGPLEGKVLVINKDYNFAVINLGSEDGVSLGSVFSVYHNDKYIGDVKVEKVHDSMAAAGFVSEEIKNKVSEDDKVVQKVK